MQTHGDYDWTPDKPARNSAGEEFYLVAGKAPCGCECVHTEGLSPYCKKHLSYWTCECGHMRHLRECHWTKDLPDGTTQTCDCYSAENRAIKEWTAGHRRYDDRGLSA